MWKKKFLCSTSGNFHQRYGRDGRGRYHKAQRHGHSRMDILCKAENPELTLSCERPGGHLFIKTTRISWRGSSIAELSKGAFCQPELMVEKRMIGSWNMRYFIITIRSKMCTIITMRCKAEDSNEAAMQSLRADSQNMMVLEVRQIDTQQGCGLTYKRERNQGWMTGRPRQFSQCKVKILCPVFGPEPVLRPGTQWFNERTLQQCSKCIE